MKRILAAAMIAALSACGGGGGGGSATGTSSPIIPATPTIVPTPTSTPIPPGAQYVALGDSITEGLYSNESYAAIVSNDIGAANFTNLGMEGATSSTLVANELPSLPASAQIITIFVGTNDELEYATNHTSGPYNIEQTFAANLSTISKYISAHAPMARVLIANLPNLANFPEWKTGDTSTRNTITALNQAMNKDIDALGYQVVDLRCDPKTYDPNNLYDSGLGYGFVHPNTQGDVYYATDFYATIQGSLRESQSCSFTNLV